MEDDDLIDASRSRIELLGFRPQKEIIYNKLLPFADRLDEESTRWLREIKSNLSKAVMLREIRPACGLWSAHLAIYIKLYGFKFSKKDHVALIHLVYEILTIPNLEAYLVNKFAQLLIILLKKKRLLSPDDLTLEWRPLYDLCKRIIMSNHTQLGMYRFCSWTDHTLCVMVQAARFYFPDSATREILDEFKPQMSPLASPLASTGLLNWFLPVALPPEKAHLGYKLWFEDMMELWLKCDYSPSWEVEIMCQIAALANNNIGYIDWEPYIPTMFNKILRSFNLPVTYKQQQSPKVHKAETCAVSLWIVSVLGGGSSCQRYLDKFLKTIESYFHPANFGVWFIKLKEFLRKLPQAFVQRLQMERHKKPTWQTPVPESHRLTEEDIDRFVESMKGIARQAVFSKLGCSDVPAALQHLALLRPKMIIPFLIERMYSTLHSVTEPHKLTSVMQCMVAVARTLVRGPEVGYPEGPTHVIPMLMLTLPGIDANDFGKCIVTFQFISMFVTLVPLVDSSKASEYYSDLTEEEEAICAATATFEDFVAQLFDRLFSFIESSTLETTRMEKDMEKRSKTEQVAEGALSSVCGCVLAQCSSAIFKTALKKLHTFVTERILETKVAGRLVATLCRKFSALNPEETFKCLVPHLCNTIMALTECPDIQKEETLDEELLYNMLLLSELFESGLGILPYVPQITAVLDRTIHLSCREGYTIATKMLNQLLLALTTITLVEYRSRRERYDKPVGEYLPIRDWGAAANIKDLDLEWYVPGPEEIACVQEIVSKYLPYELERIEGHVSGDAPLTREQLHCSLQVILGILGAYSVLPMWDEDPLLIVRSRLKTGPFPLYLGISGEVNMPDGSNVRQVLVRTMDRLQGKILSCTEGDTKSLFAVIQILEILLLNKISRGLNFELHWKNFQIVKKVLEDPLVGRKGHPRVVIIDRTMLQLEGRREKAVPYLTQSHKVILHKLLELSCSHYSEVRSKAQGVLFQGFTCFFSSYILLVNQLVENLSKGSAENDETLEGTLYVLLGPKQTPLITRHNWDIVTKVWPAVIKMKPSEKPAVIKLLDSLVKSVHKYFPTLTLNLEVPERCVERTKCLERQGPELTEKELEEGARALRDKNEANQRHYYNVLDTLVDAVEDSSLHWRHQTMALSFLRDLVHPDFKYPARVVKTILNSLINDSLELRKIALRSALCLLEQQKRPHKKIKVDIQKLAGVPIPEKLTPGIRPDNLWLQYDKARRPLTAEAWDEPRYLHRSSIGYFQWPRELEMYAPSKEQPSLDRTEEEMTAEEREVVAFFSNAGNVEKLIKFFSLEEKKGKDKFNGFKFLLFKGIFRNHGDAFLDVFRPHLERLVVDKHESSQRCAAEIIAGIVRGSKHWPFEKVSALWDFLGPLIRTALANMTEETVPDWGICFATASQKRDPNRNHWLLEVLMEDPLRDESSYLSCGRLYALAGALNQHEWRVAQLYVRLLEYLRPFLAHPFQNVRQHIATVLTNVFHMELAGSATTLVPRISDFLGHVLRLIQTLYSISLSLSSDRSTSGEPGANVSELTGKLDIVRIADGDIPSVSTNQEVCIRLLKIVLKWINGSLFRCQGSFVRQFYELFPLMCLLESYDKDDELPGLCSVTIAALARSPVPANVVPVALASVREVARSRSWCSKVSVLQFLQVFVFHNMFTILSNRDWTEEATEIVLELIGDERIEVREKAAEVLGGLIHCDFVVDTTRLLTRFKKAAKVKDNLRVRHSGVLGLCAFVNSSPYDVPDCVPGILFILGQHLSDQQPIPAAIRKTLNDFKRTHHDDWEAHKLKFTEEELEVLNDLFVPPSYYA